MGGHATDPDQLLLTRLRHGDVAALAALYDRHGRAAFTLAVQLLGDSDPAASVVEEVFLAIWRGTVAYRPDRGPVRGWLLTTVCARAHVRERWGGCQEHRPGRGIDRA